MIDAKAVTAFLRKCVGNLWIFSLVLFTVEQLMDDEFICPCERIYNVVTCVVYALVPSFGCFVFTFVFADLSSSTQCGRAIYSSLTALVWLCLFFLDGRYLACGLSYWTGVDAKHDTMGDLNWCKPTGGINVLPAVECQEKTVKWMSMSH
ncbi:calcium homeostasis modulator protein 6-like, partial [Clarias magur]